MLIEAALALIAGFLAKTCDEQSERGLPYPAILFYAAALAYGAILGWLSVSTALSSLFLALALAAILSRKIDHPIHVLGIAAFGAVLIWQPMAQFDAWAFSLFLLAGLLDELELKLGRIFTLIGEQRLWTPLAALALMLYGGQYLFLVAIVAFDAAYRFSAWLIERRLGAPQAGLGGARATPAARKKRMGTGRKRN